jgi:hypothetical protein
MDISPIVGGPLAFGCYLASVAERDVDLLLLEEFHASEEFVAWFCDTIGVSSAVFDGAWHSVSDVDGETDILLRVMCDGRHVGVLIENKIAANEQERQADRYRIRAERARDAGKFHRYLTVMVAPERYLASLPESSVYDRQVSYEAISTYFAACFDRRSRWKKQVIDDAISQQRRGGGSWVQKNPDEAITRYHIDYTEHVNRMYPEFVKKHTTKVQGKGSIWLVIKAINLPLNRIQFEHRTEKSAMYLSVFNASAVDMNWDLTALPPDIRFEQKPKSVTLNISIPPVDMTKPFADQFEQFQQAMAAVRRLLPYAESGHL